MKYQLLNYTLDEGEEGGNGVSMCLLKDAQINVHNYIGRYISYYGVITFVSNIFGNIYGSLIKPTEF